jgi:uncharacterized repeat protein (TIGR03833 family)
VSGDRRDNIKPGIRILIVQKQDQRTGKVTEVIVETILTSSSTHPQGIEVRLVGGIVGRVKKILP